ncbi:helix-turn-helix transcriptional regulator [Streptomyces rectiverticillatus]|uniref:helix-turn-helix domain-containing protein n=1 Tax=Streptomyces rectiverticillatus TaxID=173860 RepID=UPI0015C37F31|nr:helix-turn-helix transcriptional regulator [Streptomyces rectiverticillatus]QLE73663.1 helix-turn-helix transcriptional regulator [Streptomyces rectiverticillatus]
MASQENKDRASTAAQLTSDIVRLLRKLAGMTQEELAKQIGYTGSAVSALETGAQPANEKMLDRLEGAIGCGMGIFTAAKKYVRLDKYPTYFKDFARLEQAALTLCTYETLLVDGLFQTQEYARALIGGGYPPLPDYLVEELVEARMARKAIFDREPTALIEMVLEESVVRRPFGSWDILRGQLRHLIEVSERPNVSIQVLPMDRGLRGRNAGARGPMKLVQTPEHRMMVYLEVQDTSNLISEPADVTRHFHRYTKIREQSLGRDDSMALIERVMGEL